MLELLLKKNEYTCLTIFEYLAKKKRLEKHHVLDALMVNTNTFARYIETMNADLQMIELDSPIFIKHSSEVLELIYKGKLSAHTIYCLLANHYLEASNSYRIICALLKKNKQQTQELLFQLNLSKSYLNKLVTRINQKIAPTKVKISQRSGQIFFYGPETHIIFFEFLMQQFINVFSLPLPIDLLNFPQLVSSPINQKLDKQSLTNQIRLVDIYNILKRRHYLLATIHIRDPYIKPILTSIVSDHDLVQEPLAGIKLSDDARLFVNLLPRLVSSQLDTAETRAIIVTNLLANNQPMTQDLLTFSKKVLAHFIPNYDLSQPSFHDFFYIAHVYITYLSLLKFDTKSLFLNKNRLNTDLNLTNQPLYHKLVLFFDEPSTYQNVSYKFKQIMENNKMIFIDACHTLIRSFQQPILTITLDFINNLAFEYFLHTRLTYTFNHALTFVQDDKPSDLIIADHLIKIPQQTQFFSFVDTNSPKQLSELQSLIALMLNEKILADSSLEH